MGDVCGTTRRGRTHAAAILPARGDGYLRCGVLGYGLLRRLHAGAPGVGACGVGLLRTRRASAGQATPARRGGGVRAALRFGAAAQPALPCLVARRRVCMATGWTDRVVPARSRSRRGYRNERQTRANARAALPAPHRQMVGRRMCRRRCGRLAGMHPPNSARRRMLRLPHRTHRAGASFRTQASEGVLAGDGAIRGQNCSNGSSPWMRCAAIAAADAAGCLRLSTIRRRSRRCWAHSAFRRNYQNWHPHVGRRK